MKFLVGLFFFAVFVYAAVEIVTAVGTWMCEQADKKAKRLSLNRDCGANNK